MRTWLPGLSIRDALFLLLHRETWDIFWMVWTGKASDVGFETYQREVWCFVRPYNEDRRTAAYSQAWGHLPSTPPWPAVCWQPNFHALDQSLEINLREADPISTGAGHLPVRYCSSRNLAPYSCIGAHPSWAPLLRADLPTTLQCILLRYKRTTKNHQIRKETWNSDVKTRQETRDAQQKQRLN